MEKETPLIIAAKTNSLSSKAVAELLSYGGDPWIRDTSGQNALDWGRAKGNDLLVKQMRQARYQKM
jgi:ankyrin repeat protein